MHVTVGIIFLVIFKKGSALRQYNPEQAVDMYASEQKYVWRTPSNVVPYLRTFSDGAKYMGLLISGQAEFNWLLDVREDGQDQERWAIGNLVNNNFGLTACHILDDWDNEERKCVNRGSTYRVLFCTNYLWEDYARYDIRNQEKYRLRGGTDVNPNYGVRTIVFFLKHPRCDCTTRKFDATLFKIDHPIMPIAPVISYMPTYGSRPNSGQVFEGDVWEIPTVTAKLQLMERRKLVCYVASFGRKHVNAQNPPVLDYKVKYRAYYADWAHCLTDDMKRHMCASDRHDFGSWCPRTVAKDSGNQFMCFRTYSSHGAVCEHDRGAPLVCDGEVYGWVIRGVQLSRCNNRLPMPFIIAKINILSGDFLSSGAGLIMTPGPDEFV